MRKVTIARIVAYQCVFVYIMFRVDILPKTFEHVPRELTVFVNIRVT